MAPFNDVWLPARQPGFRVRAPAACLRYPLSPVKCLPCLDGCSPVCPPQLPLPPRSTAYALLKDGWRIRQGGVMQGFDAATWMVVALQVPHPLPAIPSTLAPVLSGSARRQPCRCLSHSLHAPATLPVPCRCLAGW